jgi:hypothetical protein
LDQLLFAFAPDDHVGYAEALDLLRGSLSVATRRDDECVGVQASRLAKQLPPIAVGGVGNRAGVEDIHLSGLRFIHDPESLLLELSGPSLDFGVVELAAEGSEMDRDLLGHLHLRSYVVL